MFWPEPIEGHSLRLDGYYYRFWTKGDFYGSNVFYLYANGVCRYAHTFQCSDINTLDSLLQSHDWEQTKPDRSRWGAFRILNNQTIEIQRWLNVEGIDPLVVDGGRILSDTSLVINERLRPLKNEDGKQRLDKVYLFRQSQFKPDSVSTYLTNSDKS